MHWIYISIIRGFCIHLTGVWRRCPGAESIMSSWNGGEGNGARLWAGKSNIQQPLYHAETASAVRNSSHSKCFLACYFVATDRCVWLMYHVSCLKKIISIIHVQKHGNATVQIVCLWVFWSVYNCWLLCQMMFGTLRYLKSAVTQQGEKAC